MQITLIGIRDSLDHRSVRNREVKFIRIYSLGPRFSVRSVRVSKSPYYRGFLMKTYGNFVGTLETVRNRGFRIGDVRLYCNSVLVDFFSFIFL